MKFKLEGGNRPKATLGKMFVKNYEPGFPIPSIRVNPIFGMVGENDAACSGGNTWPCSTINVWLSKPRRERRGVRRRAGLRSVAPDMPPINENPVLETVARGGGLRRGYDRSLSQPPPYRSEASVGLCGDA